MEEIVCITKVTLFSFNSVITFLLFIVECEMVIGTAKSFGFHKGRIDLQNYCKCPIRIEIIIPCHVLCSFCVVIIFILLI